MSTKFTCSPKVVAVLAKCPEEHRDRLLWALARHGAYGEEPQFDEWELRTLFEALKGEIKRQGVS